MVGMTISMIIMVGMFVLYKYSISNIFGNPDNRGMIANANQEAQLGTGLLRVQQSMQGAGFGISASANTNIVLANAVTIAINTGLTQRWHKTNHQYNTDIRQCHLLGE